jgi:cobaltochelatase CobT
VTDPAASLIGPLLGAALIIAAVVARAWRRRRPQTVEDGPTDEPYRVFSRSYDLVLSAREVPLRIATASPDVERGWCGRCQGEWQNAKREAEALLATASFARWPGRIIKSVPPEAGADTIVAILVDQSGSMRGRRMIWTATSLMRLVEALDGIGAKSEVLGFSTAGWHGGFARRDWRKVGRPKRPGRLCALMHIIYKEADDPLHEDAWPVLLHPDVLRENVDGEALLWAANRLRSRPERRKILLVVSDGAPVDDATLQANGPSYLWRHLGQVVAELESRGDIELASLMIGGSTGAPYARNECATTSDKIPEALERLVGVFFKPGEAPPGSG